MQVLMQLMLRQIHADIAEKKIASLLHLAKKDRYVAYRDLIYYTAAQIEMQNKNYPQAYDLCKKKH